jgi:hypothetical protein
MALDEVVKGAIFRARASCGGSVVLMEEAAESVAAPYLADARSWRWLVGGGQLEVERAMRPLGVVGR